MIKYHMFIVTSTIDLNVTEVVIHKDYNIIYGIHRFMDVDIVNEIHESYHSDWRILNV